MRTFNIQFIIPNVFIGIGGSGRQSAARLAAFMTMYDVFTIEITKNYAVADWKEDIRRLLRKAGDEGTSTVFLFGDHQIKVRMISMSV